MAGMREFNARNFYNLNEDVMWDPNLGAAVPLPIPTTNPKLNEEDGALERYVGTGVSVVSLIAENLLCHPFVVLRRQCQVHYNSKKIHVVPITLVPVIIHLHQHQGITTLWKGLGSTLLIRGLSLGVEDLISKVTPLPKEITWYCTVTQFLQHTLLKGLSLAIVTPFYSASLVETVQSDIASEKPGILDVFREGFMRLLNWGGGPKGRMLPVWALVLPTVTLGLARYFFSLGLEGLISRIMHRNFKHRHEATGALPRNLPNTNAIKEIDLNARLIATIASDLAFYPFETILHRLHLQGTRTIVDNLDDGSSVLPILTNYHGPVDCYESCLAKEGSFGLYKGFGALILQYAAHIAVIRITRFLLTEIAALMHKPSRATGTHSPPVISNTNNTGHTYLLP